MNATVKLMNLNEDDLTTLSDMYINESKLERILEVAEKVNTELGMDVITVHQAYYELFDAVIG
jgi:hypothetical protein